MELLHKKEQLKDSLRSALLSIIDNDYVFIDLPYYENIGDVLIWNGTEVFLKEVKQKCLYRASFYTFDYRKLDESTIIIMQGGGNWGDLWHEHNDFRKQIINRYPQNKIIILPQTVHYQSLVNQYEDFDVFRKHSNLIVCARDRQSYELLNNNLSCQVLMLPDMAFFLDVPQFINTSGRSLFFKRADKEFKAGSYNIVPQDADVHDWPTYENLLFIDKLLYHFEAFAKRLKPSFSIRKCRKFQDYLYYNFIRKKYQAAGVNLLCQYDVIYSTRLHAAILGILLGKKVYFFDNSYGKNKNFYDTWLSDLDTIELV